MNTKEVKEQGKEKERAATASRNAATAKENEKPSCGCCGVRNAEKK